MSSETEMSQRNPGSTPFGIFCHRSLLMQGLGWIGGLGVLSSGIVWAQTDPNPDNIGGSPTTEEAPPVVKFESAAPTAVSRPSAPETFTRPERRSAPATTYRRRSAQVREQVRTSVRRRRSAQAGEQTAVRRRRQTAPAFEAPVTRRRPAAERVTVRRRLAPEPESAGGSPKLQLSAPQLSVSTPYESKSSGILPNSADQNGNTPEDFNNRQIDPTEYRIGATTPSYEAPDSVVLAERATGCQRVLQNGGGLAGDCGITRQVPANNTYRATRNIPRNTRNIYKNTDSVEQIANLPFQRTHRNQNHRPITLPGLVSRRQPQISEEQSIQIGPIRLSKVGTRMSNRRSKRSYTPVAYLPSRNTNRQQKTQSAKPTGLDYYNRIVRSHRQLDNDDNTNFIFPLSIPAQITSLFGWRIHPISGTRRFHSGTDLGAPLGTPVLAAYAGQVAVADWMGGYGLAVVLQHNEGTEETRYAHLSEVFVQPGEWVEQGTVIGRVGSTGNSTGPHLHFEIRQLMKEGWVALDPGLQLETALAQLIKALQTARSAEAPSQPGS